MTRSATGASGSCDGGGVGGACSLSAISGQCPSVDRCYAISAGPKWQKANKLRPVYWPASRGRAPAVIRDNQLNAHGPLAFRQKRNAETRDLGLRTRVSVRLTKHIPAVARLRCLACCCGSRDPVRLVDCCGYPQGIPLTLVSPKPRTSARCVYLLGENVREGATRRAEEPVTPQGPGLSSGTRKGEGGRVRGCDFNSLKK